MIRILLAEDHAMVRAGLRQILERQPDMRVIAEAQDGAEAVALALRLQPTVAVLDIGLPEVDGLDALERIKAHAPQVHVLMLTGQQNEHYVRRALQGGASGYLLKRSGADELVQAVRTVARGQLAFDGAGIGDVVSVWGGRDGPDLPAHSRLTAREREVLRLVAQGYSNGAIAARLNLSPKTVDTHRARVMAKLDLHNRAALTGYALHQGYVVVA
ncbi:MAG TPA: response regulator transcription factor [Chloroflexota bacterium]|nr:response regulator transcription factor [Chloroflexota bacterium]